MGTVPPRLPRDTRGVHVMNLQRNFAEVAVPITGPTGAMTVRNTSHNRKYSSGSLASAALAEVQQAGITHRSSCETP